LVMHCVCAVNRRQLLHTWLLLAPSCAPADRKTAGLSTDCCRLMNNRQIWQADVAIRGRRPTSTDHRMTAALCQDPDWHGSGSVSVCVCCIVFPLVRTFDRGCHNRRSHSACATHGFVLRL